MANLENMKLEFLRQTAKKAFFKVTFKIKQNSFEKGMDELRWDCKYRLHGADANGVKVPLGIGPFHKTFGPSDKTYIQCSFNTDLELKYLDEDPWFTFPHNEDEICVKIDLEPFLPGIVSDSDYSDWIRRQFGT